MTLRLGNFCIKVLKASYNIEHLKAKAFYPNVVIFPKHVEFMLIFTICMISSNEQIIYICMASCILICSWQGYPTWPGIFLRQVAKSKPAAMSIPVTKSCPNLNYNQFK